MGDAVRLNVSVITAPRGHIVVRRSLESFRQIGGFGNDVPVIVSSDGRCEDLTDLVEVIVENEKPLGNFRNWIQALELAVTHREAEYVMVCEDDIVWAKGSRDALSREIGEVLREWERTEAGVGAMSLYFPEHEARHVGKSLRDGWYVGAMKGMSTWGAQCLVFSVRQATSLLSSPKFREMRANPKWSKNVDGIVATCLNDMGQTIAYRVPCLVNHEPLGAGNSSLGYPDDRPSLRTRYFTGRA